MTEIDISEDQDVLEYTQRQAMARGRSFSKDDPLVDLLYIQADLFKRLRNEIKQDNMIKVAEALLTQERFLKGYQKTMKDDFFQVVRESSGVLKKQFEAVTMDHVKQSDERYRNHINELYTQFKQYERKLNRVRLITIVLIVLNALGSIAMLTLASIIYSFLP